ncbi:MAG: hypothetical protein P9E24_12595 [Candidatus Competibacter sp.]|nr:hypothetical protein [Candidatus Competibacter sp.]MDG4582746.1 hypothetical protein [Candidatus Competibacter sp.]
MLVIRRSQMKVFEQIAAQRFEAGLLDHLRTFFPEQAAALGSTQLGRVVRYGMQRAESRGVHTERGLYLYLALMFMLGSAFDEDPQLAWMPPLQPPAPPPAEEPRQPEPQVGTAPAPAPTPPPEETEPAPPPETPDTRIVPLYEQAMAFLDRTVGPDNEFLRQTLNVLRHPRVFEGLPGAPSFGHRVLLLLQTLAPEKYKALGDGALRALVRSGYEAAKYHGVTTESGMMNYLALAFVLGSGFDRDPLYPWAAAVLSDPALADPAQRGSALRENALKALEKCLPGCPRRAEQSAAALAKPAKSYRRIVEEPPDFSAPPVTPMPADKM